MYRTYINVCNFFLKNQILCHIFWKNPSISPIVVKITDFNQVIKHTNYLSNRIKTFRSIFRTDFWLLGSNCALFLLIFCPLLWKSSSFDVFHLMKPTKHIWDQYCGKIFFRGGTTLRYQ